MRGEMNPAPSKLPAAAETRIDSQAPPAVPTRAEAFRYWWKLGWISFGGPAGQIAIMHHDLVERMGKPGVELIVGAENDPDWGPVLLVGFGGVLAEALHQYRLTGATIIAPDSGAIARCDAVKAAAGQLIEL